MKNINSLDSKSLEARLRMSTPVDPARLERLRRSLAVRAGDAGLVDVAFEHHASPLGPLLLGATPQGLVRVGLPGESEEVVLDELAARVSARVLRVALAPLDCARRQLDEYFEGRRRAISRYEAVRP